MAVKKATGFLAEDFVRDKDAVSACSLLAEICAWAKDQGKTLYDVLMEIYVEIRLLTGSNSQRSETG